MSTKKKAHPEEQTRLLSSAVSTSLSCGSTHVEPYAGQSDFIWTASPLKAPKVTPLRYPGGKKWLYPHVAKFFQGQRPSVLLGLFAGGATVELSLLAANLCDRLVLVEKDARVAAFWRCALNNDKLVNRVSRFEPTLENVTRELDKSPRTDLDWAFWVYLKTRTGFNGILDGGMSKIQKNWRWKKVAGDLFQIRALSSRITFVEGCALEVLEKYNRQDFGAFVDPPYIEKGKLLYQEHELDHPKLFDLYPRGRGSGY